MNARTRPVDRRWPNGEVPYEVPGVWAANEALLAGVETIIAQLNCELNGQLTIRPRRSGDRDYLVLHTTTRKQAQTAGPVGRQGGAQKLHCELRSLTDDPTPVPETLMRELRRALGVPTKQPTPHEQLRNRNRRYRPSRTLSLVTV